jgi:hypothetical protein
VLVQDADEYYRADEQFVSRANASTRNRDIEEDTLEFSLRTLKVGAEPSGR